MAKSLARGIVTLVASASVTLALPSCKTKPAPIAPPTVDAALPLEPAALVTPPDAAATTTATATEATMDAGQPKPPWRDRTRVTSPDGAVAFDYPANVFRTVSTRAGSVTLKSDVSEAGMSGKGDRVFYTLTFTKLKTSPLDAVKKHLPPGFADKIPTDDETVDAYSGVNGAKGYGLAQGVEGMGSIIRIVTTHDGLSWEMDATSVAA